MSALSVTLFQRFYQKSKFYLDQESRPTRPESGLGGIYFNAIESEVTGSSKQLKGKYLKWKEEDRYTI